MVDGRSGDPGESVLHRVEEGKDHDFEPVTILNLKTEEESVQEVTRRHKHALTSSPVHQVGKQCYF